MNFQRLLNTKLGQFFISVLLGIGLASLFRRVCTEKNCLRFNGPIISEFDKNIYKYDEKCYKYSVSPATCNKTTKNVLDITDDSVNDTSQTRLGLSF